jgi:preprotein translocase subunit SecE
MKIINYIKDTRGELKHVSWPTRKQTISFTLIVIAVSLAVALYLGVFDFIFTQLLEKFVI